MTPSNANTSGLAPCPFCGGAPFDRGFRRWECGSCGAQGPAGSKADATSVWNRRVTAASAQARIAELEARVAELEASKWDVKHVDTMNDMVAMGLARDAAEARADRLSQQVLNLGGTPMA